MTSELASVWPVGGIELRSGALVLTVTSESDLAELARVLPADVEQDPGAPRPAGLTGARQRGVVLAQSYWSALAAWSHEDWMLPFTVRLDDEVVGMQWLEGPTWQERTVDSSWLVAGARGRGHGRAMRAAVLELAFGHLAAVAAVSSAVADNLASLGVSRSLGYRDVHTSVLGHSGETLQNLRLERAQWLRSGFGSGVDVCVPAPAMVFFDPEGAAR